jgi:hypothetical protein
LPKGKKQGSVFLRQLQKAALLQYLPLPSDKFFPARRLRGIANRVGLVAGIRQ